MPRFSNLNFPFVNSKCVWKQVPKDVRRSPETEGKTPVVFVYGRGERKFEKVTRALAFNERRCSFTSSSTLKNNASAKSTSGRSHQEVKTPKMHVP